MKLKALGTNQHLLILADNTEVLFSGETPVAGHHHGGGYFKTNEHFTSTTTRHINAYLGTSSAQIVPQRIIESILGHTL